MGEGNTSDKTLFLSETRVDSSVTKGEIVYVLLVLEKEEGETPWCPLAQYLVHEFEDVFPTD